MKTAKELDDENKTKQKNEWMNIDIWLSEKKFAEKKTDLYAA